MEYFYYLIRIVFSKQLTEIGDNGDIGQHVANHVETELTLGSVSVTIHLLNTAEIAAPVIRHTMRLLKQLECKNNRKRKPVMNFLAQVRKILHYQYKLPG